MTAKGSSDARGFRTAHYFQSLMCPMKAPPIRGWGVVRFASKAGRARRHNPPAKDLRVVLLRDVSGVGLRGQIASVRRGHMRNKLYPNRLAVYATPENVEAHWVEELGVAGEDSAGGGAADRKKLERSKRRLEAATIRVFRWERGANKGDIQAVTRENVAEKMWKQATFLVYPEDIRILRKAEVQKKDIEKETRLLNKELGGAFGDHKNTATIAKEFRLQQSKEHEESEHSAAGETGVNSSESDSKRGENNESPDGTDTSISETNAEDTGAAAGSDYSKEQDKLRTEFRKVLVDRDEAMGEVEVEDGDEHAGDDQLVSQLGFGLYDILVRINEEGEIVAMQLEVLKKNEKREPQIV